MSAASLPVLSRVAVRAASGKAVSFKQFGDPAKVLSLENTKESGAPGAKEARVRMLAAAVNPADVNIVQGVYGKLPQLPAVAGTEGAAVVEEVGSGVSGLKKGDMVVTTTLGTWRTDAVLNSALLTPVTGVTPEVAATLSINPVTAVRLLEDFAKLSTGDVLVQNGANSMVGQCVVQIAKARGIRTINIVRERPGSDGAVDTLKAQGGDVVVTDAYARTPEFQQLVSDLPPPSLALNCTGGRVATDIARMLAPGGTFVTYGGMSNRAIQLPTSLMIFRDIVCRGFWLDRWVEQNGAAKYQQAVQEVAGLVSKKQLDVRVLVHALADYELALADSRSHRDSRKCVLKISE